MRRSHSRDVLVAVVLGLALRPADASGQTIDELKRELEAMKQQMRAMQQMLERQESTIRKLEARGRPAAAPKVAGAPAAAPPSDAARALDEAVAGTGGVPAPEPSVPRPAPSGPALAARPLVGGTTLRLIDVSVDTLVAAGASTADDDEIGNLEGGAHDPARRGFTLQQTELSFAGAVDPYFTGEAHVIFTDSSVELEEAFATTQRLPYGLQLEAGQFFTEFGRINPLHPHAWQWIDQPVINSRVFGGDGLRNPGMRLGWLLPVPWFSQLHLGAQNASGETAVSFLGEGGGDGHGHGDEEEEEDDATTIGGRPVVERNVHDLGDLLYLARWEHGFPLGESVEAKLGGSALFGPNASGANEFTRIYGGDLVLKWRPSSNFRGWPFLLWESELIARDFEAAAVRDEQGSLALPATTLHDWGLYTQLLYGFTYPWAAGLRYEYATGSGQSVDGRAADPLRDDRHRLAPLLSWRPTEFSRLRLQYNFDRAQHLDDDAHSVWLGLEILFGQHPAHIF
jgi:hypothetical protein